MSLPANINFDKLLGDVLSDMEVVVAGWAAGRPRDETALLNRITERLSRNRRKCDVGVTSPVEMTADFFELHRRGPKQTDHYAADLAVTIDIPSESYRKTALFQLKITSDYVAILSKRQLDDGLIANAIAERSFVLAVDQERFGFRVRSTWGLRQEFGDAQESRRFNTDSWDFLVVWLLKWFRCEEAPPTKPDDPDPIEALLSVFAVEADAPWDSRFREQNVPHDFVPSRAWLRYTFKPQESR